MERTSYIDIRYRKQQIEPGIVEVGVITFKSEGKTMRLGTCFIVQKELKRSAIAFNPISEQICSIRLKGRGRNIRILNLRPHIKGGCKKG